MMTRIWGYAHKYPPVPNTTNAPLGLAPGATITVFQVGTVVPVIPLYDIVDGSHVLGNPFTADVNGYYDFYVPAQRVDVQISPVGGTPYTLGDVGPGVVQLPAYTRAGLPASTAANRGALARVVDSVRGLWMDSGTQWAQTLGEMLNAKEFGAKGDGLTDDTVALTAAMAAASVVGGTVILPPGTYLASNVPLATHVTLQGSGAASILKQIAGQSYVLSANEGAGGTANPATNLHHIIIRGVQFLGRSALDGFSAHRHLLNLNAVSEVLIEDCTFVGSQGDGIYLGSSNVAATERHNERVTIRTCHFDGDGGENRNAISVIDCSGLLIEDNSFVGYTKSTMPGPIDVEPDANAFARIRDITIRDNRFEACGGNIGEISVILPLKQTNLTTPAQHILIENNTILGGSGSGICVESLQVGTGLEVPHDVVIRNNRIEDIALWSLNIMNLRGLRIEGNFTTHSESGWILGYNAAGFYNYNVTIRDNTIYEEGRTGSVGISLTNLSRCLIEGNLFYNCGNPSLVSGIGIQFNVGVSNYLSILDNRFVTDTLMSVAVAVAPTHILTPATNRWWGNDVLGLTNGFLAFIHDGTLDQNTYDTSVLPESFPLGRSISVVNNDPGLPADWPTGAALQALLVTERYYLNAGLNKWVIQFCYSANNGLTTLGEWFYRKGSTAGNTWSDWVPFYGGQVDLDVYSTATLPESFPIGRSVTLMTNDAGLPTTGAVKQALVVTERHYKDAAYDKYIVQFCYAANNDATTRDEMFFRKGVTGNTWSAWVAS
jgi:hypothetical protein